MWNFKGIKRFSTQDILPMHWKMCISFTCENFWVLGFKSSYVFLNLCFLSDATERQRSWSTLAQVKACCLRHLSLGSGDIHLRAISQENKLPKTSYEFPRHQWVKRHAVLTRRLLIRSGDYAWFPAQPPGSLMIGVQDNQNIIGLYKENT